MHTPKAEQGTFGWVDGWVPVSKVPTHKPTPKRISPKKLSPKKLSPKKQLISKDSIVKETRPTKKKAAFPYSLARELLVYRLERNGHRVLAPKNLKPEVVKCIVDEKLVVLELWNVSTDSKEAFTTLKKFADGLDLGVKKTKGRYRS